MTSMVKMTLTIFVAMSQAPFTLPTDADAVQVAHRDIQAVPAALRTFTRYLSLHNLDAKDEAAKVLAGHVNHLSREADLVRPALVGGMLLRLNILDYGWDVKAWEKLAESDPYFHVRIETEVQEVRPWPGGLWEGKFYPAGSFQHYTGKKTSTLALAPWLVDGEEAKARLAELVNLTQSQVPVVRGDWFFNFTASGPGYYDFLGVKNEADFQKLIGFDGKLAQTFGKELREVVSISGVTLQPRAIVRHNTLGGGYWRSLDFKVAKDRQNPLRLLGADIQANYDATEQFGHLPNGMWATGLFDGKGERQDFAPPEIASDHFSKSNDKRVHVNVSCIRCHVKAGLQDLDGWVRTLHAGPLTLQSPDYNKVRELRQQYLRKLEPFLARDRAIFAESVLEVAGWKAEEYAKKYAAFWERYEDARVDVTWAARDLGMNAKDFQAALAGYLQRTGQIDTVLAAHLVGRPISIRQWEEAVPLAHFAVRGFQQ